MGGGAFVALVFTFLVYQLITAVKHYNDHKDRDIPDWEDPEEWNM